MVKLEVKTGAKTRTKHYDIKKRLLEEEQSVTQSKSDELQEDFCCNELMEYISLDNSPLAYLLSTRSYILILSKEVTLDIKYCPCCGKEFPKDLTNELVIILDKLGISYEHPKLPIEFKSDEWWKRLGL